MEGYCRSQLAYSSQALEHNLSCVHSALPVSNHNLPLVVVPDMNPEFQAPTTTATGFD